MTDTKPIECELVTSDIEKLDKLVKYASETGLEPTATTGLVKAFQPIFAKARAVIADSVGVAESVKDATCVREIRKSRACRLAIRAVRLESDATRKNQKENALRYGRAVDGFHNILLADLMPVEEMLQEAENIAERAEAARLAALQEAREKELIPYLETPAWISNLSNLTDAEYAKVLSDAKLLKQAKIDAAAKAEAEAKAKAEAERLERERIAAENARLAAEAARLKAEAEAREAAARKEREEAARALAAERLAAEAAAKAAAELARKEREAVEAKARAERLAAEAAAKQEQARLKAIADDQLKRVIAAEAAAKALRDAEAKRQSEAAAARKSAAALFGGSKPDSRPDNAKAQAFADSLRAMPLPKFTGKAFDGLPARIENLAQWIESQIGEGGLL